MTPGQAPRDPLAPHSLTQRELALLVAAERRGGVFLAWRGTDGVFRVSSFSGEEDRSWTIGRRTGMDVPIVDPQVSGLHARLQRDAGEWSVTDAGLSTNGTFVNERRIMARRLADGDRIRVGRTILTFNGKPPDIAPTALDDATERIDGLTAAQHRVLVALCEPLLADARARQPATNKQIAAELHLTVGSVKMHLRSLFDAFGLAAVPQNEKRVRLAADAVYSGIVGPRHVSGGP
jgi:hypothetical protein